MPMSRLAALSWCCLVACSSAGAQDANKIVLQPGLWATTSSGSLDGQPLVPESRTECLHPDATANVAKLVLDSQAVVRKLCPSATLRIDGQQIVYEASCISGNTSVAVHSAVLAHSRSYRASFDMRLSAKDADVVRSQASIEGVWVAADCDPRRLVSKAPSIRTLVGQAPAGAQ